MAAFLLSPIIQIWKQIDFVAKVVSEDTNPFERSSFIGLF